MPKIKGSQIRSESVTGNQIEDDTLTGDDIDESSLKVSVLTDLNGDTKIQVEESANEDKIRFDVAGSEAMIIDENGRLGINTSSPNYKLDVSGNIGLNEYLYHNGDSDTHIRLQNNDLSLVAGGQSVVFNSSSGLTVSGSIQPNSNNVYDLGSPSMKWANLHVDDVTIENALTVGEVSAPGDLSINAVGGDIRFKDNGTTVMIIEDGGNVGIGSLVSNPSYHLHLKKNTTSPMIYIDNIATDNSDFIYAKSSFDTDPDWGSYFLRWQDAVGDSLYYVRGNGSGGSTVSSSFTAGHDTVIENTKNLLPGMIVESTGEVWYKPTDKTFDTGLPKCRLSYSAMSKKVFGVIGGQSGHSEGSKPVSDSGGKIVNGYLQIPGFPSYGRKAGVAENEVHINTMSIGEGVVWVTNIVGAVDNGDLICSSDILGFGQLQSDDIMRSITVAKCTESIPWESVEETVEHNGSKYKKYLTACTFHCG